MPTYEYKREDGTVFEAFQSMSDDPLTVCPTTGQSVKRLISGGTGLVFKGSGFYVTDYTNGSTGSKPSASNGNGESSTTAEKSTSSENKSKSND